MAERYNTSLFEIECTISSEYNCRLGFLKSHECHKFGRLRIDLSTKAHHARKVGFMVVRGMPYSKYLR